MEPELNTYEFADVLKAMAQIQQAAAGVVAAVLRLSARHQLKAYEIVCESLGALGVAGGSVQATDSID